MALLAQRQSGLLLLLALKAHRGLLVPLARLDLKATPETLAQPVLRALQGLQEQLGRQAHKVQPVLMVQHTVILMVEHQAASMVAL